LSTTVSHIQPIPEISDDIAAFLSRKNRNVPQLSRRRSPGRRLQTRGFIVVSVLNNALAIQHVASRWRVSYISHNRSFSRRACARLRSAAD
jgi:hypothetical protein